MLFRSNPYNIFDIRRGVLKVIEDDIFREALIEKGQALVKKYHIDTVQKMYEDVFGLFIPRTAQKQYKASTKVSKDEMSVGDLLFFMSGSSPSGWHVAVYLGNNLYMHAANKRTGVVTNELTQSTIKRIYAVGRFNKPIFDMYFYLRNLKS